MNILLLPDGSRRWAKENGLSFDEGYRQSAKKLARSLEWLDSRQIHEAWVTVCTTKNLQRPAEQVKSFLEWFLRVEEFTEMPLGFSVSPAVEHLPEPYRQRYKSLPNINSSTFKVHYLVGWSVDDEMVRLANQYKGSSSEVTKEELLTSADISQPIDLIIRTGKVKRLSGMIPWQSPYVELYFIDKYWPDINETDLAASLEFFGLQQRRQGL